MKTKNLIKALEYKESSTVIHLDCRTRDEIIKRLEEYHALVDKAKEIVRSHLGMKGEY